MLIFQNATLETQCLTRNTRPSAFLWEEAVSCLGCALDPNFMSRLDTVVNAALGASTKPYVILDVHNYARYNGQIVNQGGPSVDQFTSLWYNLAQHYQGQDRIIVSTVPSYMINGG